MTNNERGPRQGPGACHERTHERDRHVRHPKPRSLSPPARAVESNLDYESCGRQGPGACHERTHVRDRHVGHPKPRSLSPPARALESNLDYDHVDDEARECVMKEPTCGTGTWGTRYRAPEVSEPTTYT